MPTRRPDDEYDDPDRRPRDDPDDRDDRPRRRRQDYDDRPPPKSGGVGRILLILVLVAGGGVVLCCGGCGLLVYYAAGRQVTVLDASRTANPKGGTSAVTVTVRIGGDSPGGFVRGDYYFMFKAGGRQSVHNFGLRGAGGGEFKSVFPTPELVEQPGPVEFWVERRDKDSVFRVSPVHTIP
ncbi:MAG TPA: hypothetical protein VH092_27925 [Urbifossiella sp.]|nr:hypothetical protein [Urbifossiella sp.]